ncbi:hypothetical protein APHAL10511_007439 [Amanita phalloides]|nr:hypothetical protein APHAL10511_007439 [Amanita phalloides]
MANQLLFILDIPHILSCLLSYLHWHDFYSLSNTCRHCHLAFDDAPIRDAVLSRYVPWYAHAARQRDPQKGYKDVPVSLNDLDLLLTSQRIPLHQYPFHARHALASSQSASRVTSWLTSLTHAHSRFVLLLQAYVHSSNDALRPETEDVWMPRFAASPSALRRLAFPPPLSYYGGNKPPVPGDMTMQSKNSLSLKSSSLCNPEGATRLSRKSHTFPFLRPSRSRLQSDYPAIRTYSNSLRRVSAPAQLSRGMSHQATLPLYRHVVPKVPSRDSFPCSSSSSTSPPRTSSCGSLLPSTGTNSSNGSISGSGLPPSPSSKSRPQPGARTSFSSGHPKRMISPFDISFAVSRARAPILRVFVPCSYHSFASQELFLCEQQLIDAGLWDHLSAGDLICNLGYVDSEGDDTDIPFHPAPDADFRISRDFVGRSEGAQQRRNSSLINYSGRPAPRRWLLFNGQFLEPHVPPQAVHLPDPLSLPTPFYYMHIMPSYANPVYVIDELGLEGANMIQLETRLLCTTMKVRSPHSPAGYALAQKYAWTARVSRSPIFCHKVDQELRHIGDGWVGEWILEGEGTKEGKEVLLDCIQGKVIGPMEWEVIVERCGGGRVWLRLLSVFSRTKDMHSRTTFQSL